MKRIREAPLRLFVAWQRFKADETGAQTLEWLALALLILGILAAGATLNNGSFGDALKKKFEELVGKIGT